MPAWPSPATRPELVAAAASLAPGAVFAWHFAAINRGLGEVGLASLGLLYGAGLADPYLLMTGPTAHASPVMGGLIVGIFSAAGVGTEGSRVLLGLTTALWYAAGVLVAVRLLAELGVARGPRWLAATAADALRRRSGRPAWLRGGARAVREPALAAPPGPS